MADRPTPREMAKWLASAVPIHVVLPPGELRTHAAVHYHGERSSSERVCRYLERTGHTATRYLSTALIAGRAARDTCRPTLCDEVATQALDRFPDVVELHWLASEARGLTGDYAGALEAAEAASELDPGSPELAARVVRWHYWARDRSEADRVAVTAVGRFPRSTRVLWEACAQCRAEDQFVALDAAWMEAVEDPGDVPAAVRPLATGAAHAGLLDTAVELYAHNVLRHLGGVGRTDSAGKPRIADQDLWATIKDVADALRRAEIPFFFANGTALGFVREGRPLRHDTDVDIGIFDDAWTTDRVLEAFRGHRAFVPFVLHPDDEKLLVHHRSGTPVDVFRYFEGDGLIWHSQAFVRWHNSPFRVEPRSVGGLRAPLPADPDRYLTECYGRWRTPAVQFDAFVDAPNVEVVWAGYQQFPRLRRMHDRFLADGDQQQLTAEATAVSGLLRRTASGRDLLAALPVPS